MDILQKTINHQKNSKESKEIEKINKWFKYYKLHLRYLYSCMIDISKNNNITIINDKRTFRDFVYTIYENSRKTKIDKNLLNIII